MGVVDSSVKIPAVAVGPDIDNVAVTTTVGLVNRQGTVPSDPEDPVARQAVMNGRPAINRYGAVVRQAPPYIDTGRQLLTNSAMPVLVATVAVIGVLLMNLTDQVQKVHLTDGNDLAYLNGYPLAARQVQWIPFGGVNLAGGVKWWAENDACVAAQLKGDP